MQSLPHQYRVAAIGKRDGPVELSSSRLVSIASAAPAEFGGPGDLWSPETLLVGAVVDCFILSFRAIARASSLDWETLQCEAEGTLDRVDRSTRFTAIQLRARLAVPTGTNESRAARLLQKAEESCLITQSLACPVHLDASVESR